MLISSSMTDGAILLVRHFLWELLNHQQLGEGNLNDTSWERGEDSMYEGASSQGWSAEPRDDASTHQQAHTAHEG